MEIARKFVGLQARYLEKKLKDLHLESIEVDPTPEDRDARSFSHHPTLAYTSFDELSVAMNPSS